MRRTTLPLLLLAFTAAAPALAGPAADAARQRVQAIAANDTTALAAAYAPAAMLEWVGGPLDGHYQGEALAEVWRKFAAAQGPLRATIGAVAESANPRGATVTAAVLLEGRAALRVRHVTTWRDGRLVNEVWQIDPSLAVAATSAAY